MQNNIAAVTVDLPYDVSDNYMGSLAKYHLMNDESLYDSSYTRRGAWKHAWFDGLYNLDFDFNWDPLSLLP